MEQALNVHRLHFAFTITFHYIFSQLTMHLAMLVAFVAPRLGFGLICGSLVLHLRPEATGFTNR
jgi:hypothetical protein